MRSKYVALIQQFEGVGESIPTAQQWNKDVVGWNLGNAFECSAPGQDGESMQIGNPDGSIHAETAWGSPVVTKKVIQAVKKAGFNAIRIQSVGSATLPTLRR